MPRLLLAFLLCSSFACVGALKPRVKMSTDELQLDDVRKAQAAARSGGVKEVRAYAQAVQKTLVSGAAQREQLDGQLLRELDATIERSRALHPEQTAELLFSKGGAHLGAKDTEGALAAWRASMQARPSPVVAGHLAELLAADPSTRAEVKPTCKAGLSGAVDSNRRFELIATCLKLTEAKRVDEALPWAGAEGVAFYKKELGDRRALAEYARSAEAQRPVMNDSSRGAPAKGSTSSGWRITLKNACSRTVALFVGTNPKFGSGTRSSLGANTVTSYSGTAGQQLFLVTDRDEAIAVTTPTGGSLQVTPGCSGFAPY